MIALIPYYLLIGLLSLIWSQPVLVLCKPKQNINPILAALIGLCFMSIMAMLMLFCGPIHLSTQILFWIGSLLLAWVKKDALIQQFLLLWKVFNAWNVQQKIGGFLLLIPILYQSAQASKIHDNGAYYQQTIQWMEQFGLVKGLANIYPALGLYSNWHALTALLDLNQIGLGSYHQVNGFLMLLFLAWAFNEYFVHIKKAYLLPWIAIGLFLGFFYLTAPSADLPVLLFSGILIYYFLKGIDIEESFLFACVALAVFLIKPPAMIAVGMCVYLVYLNRFNSKKNLMIVIFGMAMLGAFFYKNTILSGYPMYPTNKPDLFNVEWKVPKNWNEIYTKGIISWGVSDKQQIETWRSISSQEKPSRLTTWLNRKGYKGFMNQLLFFNWLLALLFLIIFAKRIWKTQKALFFLLLFLIVAHYWEWLSLSQYRLMLPTGMGLLLIWLKLVQEFINPKLKSNWIQKTAIISVIGGIWMLSFSPFQLFQDNSRNKQITTSTGFNTRYLITPFHQYEYGPMSFIRIKGKAFYHYQQTNLSWNCALPCVSKSHHDFLLKNLGYEVQQMGESPASGYQLVKQINP